MDNILNHNIFQLWTDTNPITQNRQNCLATCKNVANVNWNLLDPEKIKQIELKDHPFHPGYRYLCAVHKSDYLRSYIMNFYGGGYADIKFFCSNNNWAQCFDTFSIDKNVEIIGQAECHNGSPIVQLNSIDNLKMLVSNGWFICRPHSRFTEEWHRRVQLKMDQRQDILARHPATTPYGGNGYPMRWAELQGEIFHQLCQETYQDDPRRILRILKPGVIAMSPAMYR